ncbi:unnamed protein product [Effrenium voratum]|nr:unnamed protein product [Effrenium voratum]|mmetsp:Transcript_40891/g.97471  ORF Transcript_40891/g.97471 Transcript_40891/m.97471 type:complete len:231 (+) Transcript_40891:34-726(+)
MRAPLLCFLSALVDADGPASTTAATSASPAVHRSFEGNGDWLIREDGASKSDSTWCWRTVEIGSWFQSGRALAEVVPINVTEDQAPGVSLAVGVLSETVEGRVNDLSMSTAVCGSSYHWSVAYGHGEGVEILGNKWGDGGIYNENVVHVLVDMDARTLAYAVNGQCHGTKSLSASRVRLAAAVSRPKDAIRLGDGASAPACLFEAAQAASAASASARGVAWAVVLAWISS